MAYCSTVCVCVCGAGARTETQKSGVCSRIINLIVIPKSTSVTHACDGRGCVSVCVLHREDQNILGPWGKSGHCVVFTGVFEVRGQGSEVRVVPHRSVLLLSCIRYENCCLFGWFVVTPLDQRGFYQQRDVQPAFILKSSQVFQEVMKQILKVLKQNKADGNGKFNGKFWGSAALRP